MYIFILTFVPLIHINYFCSGNKHPPEGRDSPSSIELLCEEDEDAARQAQNQALDDLDQLLEVS